MITTAREAVSANVTSTATATLITQSVLDFVVDVPRVVEGDFVGLGVR